ncbi:hypothetical protein BLX24_05475 [Arsenicibacter rosenii]|uniref:Uncharacterized protein n=2 Tax=Arsenicibacter rosenii TaxID=1750698 RepID=A0A1S2VNC5_9BACT|nr:hypothetical protein BLX24_05475 [Arsenicibacter rosenii]
MLQIVVVDNSSTPDDYHLLQKTVPAFVSIIRSKINLGYAAGNNLGLTPVAGLPKPDAYLIINSDVWLTNARTIQHLADTLARCPNAMAISPLVHTRSNEIPVSHQIQVRRLLPAGWLICCHSPLFRRLFYRKYQHFIYRDLVPYPSGILRVDTVNGACFLIRQAFFEQFKGFDEHTFLYLEELILGFQIRQLGRHCLLHGHLVADHQQGQSTRSLSAKTRFCHFLNSEAYLLTRYYGVYTGLVILLRRWRWLEFYLKRLWQSGSHI